MSKAINITGQRFGRLTALKPTKNRNSIGSIMWLCECDCGTIKEISRVDLNRGTKSCGCLSREKSRRRCIEMHKRKYHGKVGKDLTGQRFGKLVAIKPMDKRVRKKIVWELKCDCGNITYVNTGHLSSGEIRSCGCLHKEVMSIPLVGNKYGRLLVIEQGKYIGDKIGWVCKCECGNMTEVTGDRLKSGKTRSCGCIKKEMAGTNHPNYNPNKTDEERLKGRYILGKHTIDGFRNKVYQRDKHTCRVCGQVGKELNAHHLDGWNWAKGRRFDVSNGVTLCKECHVKFHKTYGNGGNTKEQFEEFKNKQEY